MKTPFRLAAYAVGLVVVFVAAWGVGNLAGPSPAPAAHDTTHESGTDDGHESGTDDGHESGTDDNHGSGTDDGHGDHAGGGQSATAAPPGGLQVAQDGYRLVPVTPQLATAAPAEFAFRVLGPDGAPVTRYTPTHEKDLHLIVVRRDLTGYQHLHPTLGGDGTWSIPLRAGAPGQYRVFADFQPAGRDKGLTLGVDVPAPGDYRPTALPAPAHTASVDGYSVSLAGDLVPGTASRLTLQVSKDGAPVTDLQPYLGAYGHLVALRDGDLAYLHVHPDGAPGDGRTRPGPEITFTVEVPSTGSYRLYLDFQHGSVVRTAEFTAVAGDAGHGHD